MIENLVREAMTWTVEFARCASGNARALTVATASLLANEAAAQTCAALQDLAPPNSTDSHAYAVSADGNVVVGSADIGGTTRAFHWSALDGMQLLESLGGNSSVAFAVSADGRTVVGTSRNLQGAGRPVLWTPAGAVVDLGSSAGRDGQALAVSSDGSVVVGYRDIGNRATRAFRWTAATGVVDLGTFGGSNSTAYAVSADGAVVVGSASDASENPKAFRWTAATNMQPLGSLGGFISEARAVSGDGSVVVGYAYVSGGVPRAFRWTQPTGMRSLGTLGGFISDANSVSADGSVVVGQAFDSSNNPRAFVWTTTSSIENIDTIGGSSSNAKAISANGEVVIGVGVRFAGSIGFCWTRQRGIETLGTLGGSQSNAIAVSADGTVIVGSASDAAGRDHAFRLGGDTDGDGLLDDWECNGGIPYTDAAGQARRYRLPNANWLKKDIYVEVDAMAGRAPSAATLQQVIDAFDPPRRVLVPAVLNVSGALPNITLHIDMDPSGADLRLSLAAGGDYTLGENGFGDFGFDKSRYFGTPAERTDSDWGTPANPGPKQLAKLKAYRYCIFANSFSNSASSGVAKGIPSNDFMVTLGRSPTPGGTTDQQAATFMHELGHTLGLGHGGGPGDSSTVMIGSQTVNQRDVNFKPNYYSIMNYWWQFPASWQRRVPPYIGSAWGLRYSEATLPSLDENSLSEAAGLGAGIPGGRVPFSIPFPSCPDDASAVFDNVTYYLRFASMDAGQRVDWNGDCSDQTLGRVSANLNERFDASRTVLNGHSDWANLIYNFRTSPTYAPGSPAERLDCSFTPALMAFMDSLPPPCTVDFNGDDFVDFFDYSDYVACFEEGVCPAGRDADFNADGFVDFFDYADYVAAFEAGC